MRGSPDRRGAGGCSGARPQDVVAAPLGHLEHGVAPDDHDAASLGDDPKPVLHAPHRAPVDDQFLCSSEANGRSVLAGPPLSQRVWVALRRPREPVQTGDGEESVRVRKPGLHVAVPLFPFTCEGPVTSWLAWTLMAVSNSLTLRSPDPAELRAGAAMTK